ncbi:hypothetical protein PIB30_055554 [Stylosanthes scabra]|uniref:Uncharacterized protein n=1 Tax=Stylosanthes scabra TaxID=79078 RepID=A0ABU6WHD5_9FABA|nr:hypothetical protein [Stylosanthes scabra]
MRHMHDCIRNEKLIALPYGMFLTKIFESYCIDFHDEPYEQSYSQLKGGGAVKRTVKRDLAAERRAMEEEKATERASNKASSSRSSDSSQIKLLHVATERVQVQKKYVDKLKADHMFSDAKEEEEENEEDGSEPSDA